MVAVEPLLNMASSAKHIITMGGNTAMRSRKPRIINVAHSSSTTTNIAIELSADMPQKPANSGTMSSKCNI